MVWPPRVGLGEAEGAVAGLRLAGLGVTERVGVGVGGVGQWLDFDQRPDLFRGQSEPGCHAWVGAEPGGDAAAAGDVAACAGVAEEVADGHVVADSEPPGPRHGGLAGMGWQVDGNSVEVVAGGDPAQRGTRLWCRLPVEGFSCGVRRCVRHCRRLRLSAARR